MRYARQRLAVPISVIPSSPRIAGMTRPSAPAMTPSGSHPTGKTMFTSRAVSCQRSTLSRSACCVSSLYSSLIFLLSTLELRGIDFPRLKAPSTFAIPASISLTGRLVSAPPGRDEVQQVRQLNDQHEDHRSRHMITVRRRRGLLISAASQP